MDDAADADDAADVAEVAGSAEVVGSAGTVAPALEIRGVTKSFGRNVVLAGIDLVVPSGSVTAVLGPSGGGKTTLLRIVAGFDQPDSGTVSINGILVADGAGGQAPEERRVGVVPQEGALFPHLSVAGTVGFGLGRHDRRARDARISEVLELVGLPGTERKRPHELSGGMQHRVALARALAPRPAIVMLDEPFSSLDAGLRAHVRAEVLDALHASGATAVIVTHDQLEALSIADQVALLLDGRIAQAAAPTEVYRYPATLDAGTFVGEAVVLPGELLRAAAGRSREMVDLVRCALGDLPISPATTSSAHPEHVEHHEHLALAPTGASLDVLVRPEQLMLTSDRDGEDPSGAEGVVIGRQYYGHDAVVAVRLRRGPVVTARLQTANLPDIGSTVRVTATGSVAAFPRRGS